MDFFLPHIKWHSYFFSALWFQSHPPAIILVGGQRCMAVVWQGVQQQHKQATYPQIREIAHPSGPGR